MAGSTDDLQHVEFAKIFDPIIGIRFSHGARELDRELDCEQSWPQSTPRASRTDVWS